MQYPERVNEYVQLQYSGNFERVDIIELDFGAVAGERELANWFVKAFQLPEDVHLRC